MDYVQLAKEIQSGDVHAFEILYTHSVDRIYAYIVRRIENHEDAQEITADVYIKVHARIGSYDPEKSPSFFSWLYTIAHNTLIDFHRKQSQKETVEWNEDIATEDHILDILAQQEQLKKVRDFLATLDATKREVFFLRIWEDLSYKEISAMLGKSENNCKMIFSRTLKEVVKNCSLASVSLLFLL